MDHLLHGEFSLVDVNNDEQLSLPALEESTALFSPPTPRFDYITEPLTPVMEPAVSSGNHEINMNQANCG
jgi:hypothetical protein